MFFYLIAASPLFFFLVAFLPWKPGRAPRALSLMSTFLKGALIFLPAYLILLLTRWAFGFSYDGILLYLSLLQRDHLVPVLAGLGGFLLLKRNLSIAGNEEGVFLTVFSYVSGFVTMLNLTEALQASGGWDAYGLFLLPSLRLAAALFLSLFARRFFPWEGKEAGLFCGAGAACALLLGLSSFFFRINRIGWSILFAGVPLVGAVAMFAMRFPRILRD
jgi:hypothetical protein